MASANKKPKRGKRDFRSTDGIPWRVAVRVPGSSNAMVIFEHPDKSSSSKDRYAWHVTYGPEARNVTARLKPDEVLESLTEQDLTLLYRRSMPVTTAVPLPE
jgi:hypothetical protein